jgi:putative membrane protein
MRGEADADCSGSVGAERKYITVLSTLASAALISAAPVFVYPGWGFGLFFILGHVIGFLFLLFIFIALARGMRRKAFGRGFGPGHGYGYGHGPGYWHASRSAESTLTERFANGDIDEKEYRARLEVIRANAFPPAPPKP